MVFLWIIANYTIILGKYIFYPSRCKKNCFILNFIILYVRGKIKICFYVSAQSPGVMPFYGDSGAGFRPAAGFGNTVWHQGVTPVGTVAVETSAAPWPPQQFIQQIPAPNQLEELRYHTQYTAAAPYHPQTGNSRLHRFPEIHIYPFS